MLKRQLRSAPGDESGVDDNGADVLLGQSRQGCIDLKGAPHIDDVEVNAGSLCSDLSFVNQRLDEWIRGIDQQADAREPRDEFAKQFHSLPR